MSASNEDEGMSVSSDSSHDCEGLQEDDLEDMGAVDVPPIPSRSGVTEHALVVPHLFRPKVHNDQSVILTETVHSCQAL